jgi:hypothetical protein
MDSVIRFEAGMRADLTGSPGDHGAGFHAGGRADPPVPPGLGVPLARLEPPGRASSGEVAAVFAVPYFVPKTRAYR